MTLPLPISPADALAQIIDPALRLLPLSLTSDASRVLMLAIALQESGLRARQQDGGPAHGLWQFERGGVMDVLAHDRAGPLARSLCAVRGVPATSYSVYASLPGDDVLAAGVARLNLFADAAPLPVLGDAQAAWVCYDRVWRPGKPRPFDWAGHYQSALRTVIDVEASA